MSMWNFFVPVIIALLLMIVVFLNEVSKP